MTQKEGKACLMPRGLTVFGVGGICGRRDKTGEGTQVRRDKKLEREEGSSGSHLEYFSSVLSAGLGHPKTTLNVLSVRIQLLRTYYNPVVSRRGRRAVSQTTFRPDSWPEKETGAGLKQTSFCRFSQ